MKLKTLVTALAAALLLTATGPAMANPCAFDEIAIFVTNSIRLGTGVLVEGDVVANNSSPGPVLDEGVELALDRNATVSGDATAFSVDIDNGAAVTGSLTCQTGDPACTGFTPPAIPAADIPAFLQSAVRPEAQDVVVPAGTTVTLGAASLVCSVSFTSCTTDADCGAGEACIGARTTNFRDILVEQGGTLVFAGGGRFDARSISSTATAGPCTGSTIPPCRSIHFDKATELRIEGRFDSERGAYVGPTPGAAIDASDIAIHVGGQNGATGGLFEVPRAANVGRESVVHASFNVPFGTFELEKNSIMSGAVLARDAQIDKDSTITGNSAFGNKPPTADDKEAFTNGQTSIAIGLTATDPEGQVLTFAATQPPAGEGSVSVAGSTATYTKSPATDEETSFTYTATDVCGAISAPATVRINPQGGEPCVDDNDCDPGFSCSAELICEPDALGEVVANDQVCESTDPVDCELETIEDTAIVIILTAAAPCDPTGAPNPAEPCDGIGNDVPLTFSLPLDAMGEPLPTSQGGTLSGLNQGTGELQEPPGADEVPQRTASVLYTPPDGFTGVDSFTFDVEGDVDDSGDIDPSAEPNPEIASATVEISVQTFTPTPPVVARDQRVTTEENTPVEIALSGVTVSECRFDSDCPTGFVCNTDDSVCEPAPLGAGSAAPQTSASTPSSVTAELLAERQAYAKSLAARSPSRLAPQALASSTDLAAALDIPAADVASSSISGDPAASSAPATFGVIKPTRGNSLAVLSTGAVGTQAEPGTDFGAAGTADDETVLTIVLNVPAGNGLLSFDYNFLSAEHPDFIQAGFNDTFTVKLTDEQGVARVIETAQVDFAQLFDVTGANAGGTGFDLFAENPSGVDTVFVPEGQGLADAGLTGFTRAIEPFVSAGQITVEFSIRDVGDGILDSAVVLDNLDIELQQTGFTVLSLPSVGTLSYIDPITDGQIVITQVPVLLPTDRVVYTPPAEAEPGTEVSFTYLFSDGLTSDTGTITVAVIDAVVISDPLCTAVGRPPGCTTGSGAESDDGADGGYAIGLPDFGEQNVRVTVIGDGSVTSSRRETPQGSLFGLACDHRCGAKFAEGADVLLFARPLGDESEFIRWSGDCSGSEPITTVRVSGTVECTAEFGSR